MKALIALGLAAVAAAGAARAEPLDRDAVLRLARERSPAALAAGARVDEAAGALSAARAWTHNPQLEWETARRETADGSSRDRAWRVDQSLDLLGRGPRIGAARADLAAASARQDDAAAAALAEAARAWLVAVHAGRQRSLAAEGVAVHERLRATSVARHDAGETGALDVSLATVALARARAGAATARADELDALAALAAQLRWDGDELPLVAGDLDWPAPPTLAEARAAALTHPALAALAAARDAATARQRGAGALAWPELGVFGGRGREEDADLTQWGVSVSVPLFARGGGERRAAAAGVRLADLDREAATAERLARVTAAWQRRQELQAALATDRDAVTAALDDGARLARVAYEAGEIPLDEVLLAQREQLEAQRDLNDLQLAAALAALDVSYLAALPPLTEGNRP